MTRFEAGRPAVILVEPQIGENIGAAARVMKNFGLRDLRLVQPRDGWPNPAADATASHAADLLRSARLYDSVADAVADLDRIYAATARTRFMSKAFVTSRQLPADLRALAAAAAAAATSSSSAGADGETEPAAPAAVAAAPRAGLMFGRESSGLTNDEVAAAHKVLTIEADPGYPVLNLGQAVALTVYELFHARLDVANAAAAAAAAGGGGAGNGSGGGERGGGGSAGGGGAAAVVASVADELRQRAAAARLATRGELDGFLTRLMGELDESGFFESADRRAATSRSISNLAGKVEGLTAPEVALLHGMLSKLTAARRARGARPAGPAGAAGSSTATTAVPTGTAATESGAAAATAPAGG
ncbi:hypothetical protein GPECTOR_18g177 [Gonium pectorale]|uniref:tRNA/rRNA methyltransferase SpoU type domain-containing protein n=1 Tax=Gonium pectorale TaxID=33097 RepID=A0A150GJT9_GONPE|nr:hypothetical protein GPECTOR_18g177 [Gonium pectorale]|eukprot:KXZ50024.1 hypothetical protein GPECTOR_18g177 [Gonium pectorale]